MEYLFPEFLMEAEQYRKAQAFWASLCERLLVKHHQVDLWAPWLQDVKLKNGSVLLDGNPIYSLVNLKESKGVRIIQYDPKVHTKWEMSAWIDISGDVYDEPDSIIELVFTCNLTWETTGTFEKLFELWIQPECNPQDIEKLIKSLGIG
jgi:hypothetical protein